MRAAQRAGGGRAGTAADAVFESASPDEGGAVAVHQAPREVPAPQVAMVDFADLSADVCGVMFGGASVGAGTASSAEPSKPFAVAYRRDDDMDAPLPTLDSKRPRTSSTMGDLGQQIEVRRLPPEGKRAQSR